VVFNARPKIKTRPVIVPARPVPPKAAGQVEMDDEDEDEDEDEDDEE
jgi:hypothetical protein